MPSSHCPTRRNGLVVSGRPCGMYYYMYAPEVGGIKQYRRSAAIFATVELPSAGAYRLAASGAIPCLSTRYDIAEKEKAYIKS